MADQRAGNSNGRHQRAEQGGVQVIYMTEADWTTQRDEGFAKIGVTFDEVASWVDDCGCCITVPDSHGHLAEHYVEKLWWTWRP